MNKSRRKTAGWCRKSRCFRSTHDRAAQVNFLGLSQHLTTLFSKCFSYVTANILQHNSYVLCLVWYPGPKILLARRKFSVLKQKTLRYQVLANVPPQKEQRF